MKLSNPALYRPQRRPNLGADLGADLRPEYAFAVNGPIISEFHHDTSCK